MKPSRYNYSTTLPDGTSLVFNFATLALLSLDSREMEDVRRRLDRSNCASEEDEWYRILVEEGFLVEDDIDELQSMKKAHLKARADRRNLGLTIAPGLACNFACVYCYQSGHHPKMSLEVESALSPFVRERVKKGGGLSVTWFGGEPLLQMESIERQSKDFIRICADAGAKYSASVITNGYLLDGKTSRKLSDLKVTSVQVTMDGAEEIHDKRRVLRGGGGTFEKILRNIKEASRELPLSLRMNVDEKNRQFIIELADTLVREGLEKRVHFYLGRTYPYTAACSDVAGWCLTDEDFALLSLETAMEMIGRGFVSFRMPKRKNHYCLADSENGYVIEPSGGMAKCWNEIGDPRAEVGHLLEPTTEAMKSNGDRWRSRDLFTLECAECRLLPICMGGCPYLHRTTGKLHCHEWKHHLDEYLAFHHYLKQRKREGEVISSFQKSVESLRDLSSALDDPSSL